jgi:hypothetical protein
VRTLAGALLVLGSLAVSVAACGESGPKTYSDPDYGFSFQYPGDWRLLEVQPADLPEAVSRSVGALDPKGSGTDDDFALDFVSVDVFEFGPESGVSADTLQAKFASWLATTGSADLSFAVAEDPAPVKIGGLEGYQATYTYNDSGIDVRVTEYWLLSGDVLYDLYTSASEASWESNQATFEAFLDGFKIETDD